MNRKEKVAHVYLQNSGGIRPSAAVLGSRCHCAWVPLPIDLKMRGTGSWFRIDPSDGSDLVGVSACAALYHRQGSVLTRKRIELIRRNTPQTNWNVV